LFDKALDKSAREKSERLGRTVTKENLLKEFTKQPLMETSYGKYFGFHLGSVIGFLRDNPPLRDALMNVYDFNNDLDLAISINKIVGVGLQETLNLPFQKALQVTGRAFALMDTQGYIITPGTGGFQQLGSEQFSPTLDEDGNPLTVQLGTGDVVALGTVKPSANGAGITQRVIDNKTGLIGYSIPVAGSEQARQAPVLFVQGLDAATMLNAIIRANRDISDTNGFVKNPRYVIPIFDAVITNPTSVFDYVTALNSEFEIQNNKLNIIKEFNKNFEESERNFKERVKDDSRYQFNPAKINAEFKSLYAYFKDIQDRAAQAKEEGLGLSRRQNKVLTAAYSFGFPRPEMDLAENNYYLTGSQIKALFDLAVGKDGLDRETKANSVANTIKNNKEKFNELKPIDYRSTFNGQYGNINPKYSR
jgi:hypothetical protein